MYVLRGRIRPPFRGTNNQNKEIKFMKRFFREDTNTVDELLYQAMDVLNNFSEQESKANLSLFRDEFIELAENLIAKYEGAKG
jgi:hypothetical protein